MDRQMEFRTYWVCRNTECSVLGRFQEREAAQSNYRCQCQSPLESDTVETMTTCPSSFLDRFAWLLAALSALAAVAFNCYLRRQSLGLELHTLLAWAVLMCALQGRYSDVKATLRQGQLRTPAPRFERDDIACQAFLASHGLCFVVSILQPLWFFGT